MKIYYRISDIGYNKVKPDYINNESCLKNFCDVFHELIDDIKIIADNVSIETRDMITKYIDPANITYVSIGHGAGTFNLALDEALKGEDSDEIVYFVENDYVHLKGSPDILKEMVGLGNEYGLGADYGTLYIHPDKFLPPNKGGNPEVDYDGGYLTRVYRGKTELYHLTNSTTMTFASTVGNLKRDESVLRKHTSGTHPNDFHMFLELRDEGRSLLCPLNTYSTHGESQWLAPLYKTEEKELINEWKKHIING
jgi:hypothetical protein